MTPGADRGLDMDTTRVNSGQLTPYRNVPTRRWFLRVKCPNCGRQLRGIDVGETATVVCRRKCRNETCELRWQIVATPLNRVGSNGFAHALAWGMAKARAV